MGFLLTIITLVTCGYMPGLPFCKIYANEVVIGNWNTGDRSGALAPCHMGPRYDGSDYTRRHAPAQSG